LGSKRDRAFPETPTATEAGFPVALDLWRGIVVPKGTSPEVIKKLEDAIRQTIESREFQDAGVKIGFLPAFLPAGEFARVIESDDHKLAAIMGELGLKKR
jgi:tripartite-type tricarboxylate transporter receptor subunit TctC